MPYVKRLSQQSPFYISAYPNAGLPNHFGEYDQTAKEMQKLVRNYMEEYVVNIVGGCCGTTPDHIRLLSEIASEFEPRKVVVESYN